MTNRQRGWHFTNGGEDGNQRCCGGRELVQGGGKEAAVLRVLFIGAGAVEGRRASSPALMAIKAISAFNG